MIPVRFDLRAERELESAVDAYDRAREGLGTRFVRSVEYATTQLSALPLSGAAVTAELRAVPVRGFPYRLIYSLRPALGVVVVAVAHTRRSPAGWQGRG